MKTRITPEAALKSSRPTGWGWRLGLFGGVAAAATGLIVLVGNAYTLDIPQVMTNKDVVATSAPTFAAPGRARGLVAWNSGRAAPIVGPAAVGHASTPHGGGLLPAVLTTVQDVQDAVRDSDDASDHSDEAELELTAADFPIDGAYGALASGDDAGGFVGFGSSGSDGFGPPSSGGGFLSNPGGASSGGFGAAPADNNDPQGLQPLLAAPGLTGPIPEPTTWALLTLGLAGIGAVLRGQRHRRSA
ncbi:PEP-CTERM sorting domain-containing protein [Phenylobacterium sp.]|uniref:PEP-CTERM sorting domain-containing protein n=1 Tax=Phenylobacterium sp. TaxID=1871053 RepID=UPI0011FEA892|nr:PEP-CTERM sorting domain-containing protein [Phenylobacterium sp.]THD62001.1 MAG: PEP-CTERM sorting domain-containing protein [Phenylobacterium sp.]